MGKVGKDDVYIALEFLDFVFKREEVKTILDMWKSGYTVDSISAWVNREEPEVSLYLYDRFLRGMLPPRKNGWNGTKFLRRRADHAGEEATIFGTNIGNESEPDLRGLGR